jgi:acyl-CoA synthetase (AMP-forming)/AMP-acid ligase II
MDKSFLLNQVCTNKAPTLVDCLTKHANEKGDSESLIFLTDGEKAMTPMTYSQLHESACKFAAGILQQVNPGDRVILMFQSSYDFAIAFFGCMYAGVVSIPLPIPGRRKSEWTRLENIIKDSDVKVAVTYDNVYERLLNISESNLPPELLEMKGFSEFMHLEPIEPRQTQGEELVFLQYTSGSTGSPKGVMVSHNNLIANQILLSESFRTNPNTVMCSWLPLFHDMGLIGCLLQCIYLGCKMVFMAPNAFLQKPSRWLKAISDYKATTGGAPNFAYDLCVEKIEHEQIQELDLTSLDVLFNGAEPIRPGTLQKFTDKFAPQGFRPTCWNPCYGSAEATLMISGTIEPTVPMTIHAERSAYEDGKIVAPKNGEQSVELVCSGYPMIPDSVAIVDLGTNEQLPDGTIGEVFLTGPSVAMGYWNNEKATEEGFKNVIKGDMGQKHFLDTGDLGFMKDGKLYITGRTKDLLIFNGRNLFPQDIEACSEASHEALRKGRGAAVSAYIDGSERLILIHELERTHFRNTCTDKLIEQIRIAVYREFAVPVYAVALIAPSTTPMTSSGKIRRQSCKNQYLNNKLSLIALWDETIPLEVKNAS